MAKALSRKLRGQAAVMEWDGSGRLMRCPSESTSASTSLRALCPVGESSV
jgi:hypothetical protein